MIVGREREIETPIVTLLACDAQVVLNAMLKRKAVDVETNPLLVAAKRFKKDVMILLYPFYS